MKSIRSTHLASAAIVALLALPAAALAQPAQSSAPASAAASAPAVPPAASSSPLSAHPAPGANAEERVETHIKEMRAQLRITAAEQPQWDQFAQVMRSNARDMDQAFMQRAQGYPTMSAVQNMQSYEQVAEAHAAAMQKLVPAFQSLYNAMPAEQKQVTDEVFRANAEKHVQKRTQNQTGASR